MKTSNLFIFRAPAVSEMPTIRAAQKRLREIPTFIEEPTPHLTLLSGSVTRVLGKSSLERVMYPLPESANAAVSAKVEGFTYFRQRAQRRAIALTLQEHPDVMQEQKLFADRVLAESGIRPILSEPHITLGRVAGEYASLDVLDALPDYFDTDITLQKVQSVPTIYPPEAEYSLAEPPRSDPTAQLRDLTVTSLRPHSIPQMFLNSLRQSENSA